MRHNHPSLPHGCDQVIRQALAEKKEDRYQSAGELATAFAAVVEDDGKRRYKIIRELGRGGMAVVYLAHDRSLNREVAVKVLSNHLMDNPKFRARFKEEAKIIAGLEHSAIVPVYDFGEEGNQAYFVMRYMTGGSLRARLRRVPDLSLAEVRDVLTALAAALDKVHQKGFIHRDIKPGNVLFDENGKPYLADFGLARIVVVGQVSFAGTPSYMAPEQLRRGTLDARTDVYQLGMVLLKMLTRQLPPRGSSYNNLGLPFGCDKVIARALAEKKDDRYPTAGDLAAAFAAIVDSVFSKDDREPAPSTYPLGYYESTEPIGQPPDKSQQANIPCPLGTNDFEPDALTQATCAVLIEGQIVGTAWLVSDEGHLLTAGHVLGTEPPLAQVEVQFMGDDPRRTARVEWMFYEEQAIDFAVLQLTGSTKRRPLPVSLAKEVQGTFRLCGYGTTMREQTLYSSQGEFSGSMYIMNSPDKHLFRLRSSDLGKWGNSGGGVFSDDLQAVVGIVGIQTEAAKSRIGPESDVVLAMPLYRVAQLWEPLKAFAEQQTNIFSEDGQPIVDHKALQPPQEEFNPRFLQRLEVPRGVVKLRDQLYIRRKADKELEQEIVQWGTTTTIQAPRQSGKTSLLVRGIHYAKKSGAKVVFVDFQSLGHNQLSSPDIFLRGLADTICRELRLDESKIEKAWGGSPQQKLTYFLEDHVLPQFEVPIVLAMDEADCLLQTPFYQDFFGLVRSWHNRRATHYEQWEKLNLVLVISTEPYLLINDINQSPFNVGLKLALADFTTSQVQTLNQQHGSPITQKELPELMALLGGQPYLTRQAFYTLVTQEMSWRELTHNAATDQGPFAQHLQRHHWAIHDKPELKKALRQVIHANRCADDTACLRLQRAGLIKGSADNYTCRCGLYNLYFESKL